jgi:hypothetical protein
MQDDVAIALRVLGIGAGLIAFAWLLVALVFAARRGGKGMRAMGASLAMLFSWGVMRDPRNDTVAEAQQGRVRKGEEDGDKPL